MTEGTLYFKEHFLSSDVDWIVFIHGAGGSSATWYKQIKTLKHHYNLLLIDLRGHGRSCSYIDEASVNNYSFNLIVNDVLKVLDKNNIAKAHFIGMSLGTIIVRHLAEIKPSVVLSMTLAGAVVSLTSAANMLAILGNACKSIIPYLWLYKFFAWIIMPHRSQKEARKLFIREARSLKRIEFRHWFALIGEVDELMKRLAVNKPTCPTLYVMGDKDRFFLNLVRKTVTESSLCSIYVINNCGHVCNIEKNEEFNQIVIDFIESHRS
ncbi:alpha/beta fold hydrolase [Vibrio salinus]|uniref:alpha/beta fold hydrolase n=1 Tax=Vibrio salinus TaxID=2899784 RepID=UPI001E4B9B42|nr:alpha/beta hydrolase [Vibrio salinus]MCE0496273.1 alpha/beta hydrolase [Vibrio salinus]